MKSTFLAEKCHSTGMEYVVGESFNEEDNNFVFSLYSAACFCVILN